MCSGPARRLIQVCTATVCHHRSSDDVTLLPTAMDMSRDGNSFFVAYERGAKSAYEEIHLTQVMLYV